jgi:hypothetical protein
MFLEKMYFLVFWTFRELRDSKKGKVKEHGSEFSRRTLWAKDEDQDPNRLQTGTPTRSYSLATWGLPVPPHGSDAADLHSCGFVLT